MYYPSITIIISGIFISYMCHSIYQMAQLFTIMKCSGAPCYPYLLTKNPRIQLTLFTTTVRNPYDNNQVEKLHEVDNFDYWHNYAINIGINIPLTAKYNGTLYLIVVLAIEGKSLEWHTIRRDGSTIVHTINITEYMVPRIGPYHLLSNTKKVYEGNLMEGNKGIPEHNTISDIISKPVTHIRSKVFVNLLTDKFSISQNDVPPEMAHLIYINRDKEVLPIIKTDFFNTRLVDLVHLTNNITHFNFTFLYSPMSIGKLRFMLLMENAMTGLVSMGFLPKDIDEVKGIFSDTNIYLLCGTFFVTSMHVLFDFLALKNEVNFWRNRVSYEGVSTRTTLWRAFSQFVIFIYLLDEDTTLLVTVPAFFGTLIELWKCKKILHIELSLKCIKWKNADHIKIRCIGKTAQQQTDEFDKEGMRYLEYLLYPTCIIGAIYSLLCYPHRSWYSWTLHSLVNGVYSFGFLFMLPQLFVNYKLKSVAALPLRAFMYKAINTFIDDFFAFVITMPTSHRIACFRDDIVFLIYIYQRWLYPVDNSRFDNNMYVDENTRERQPSLKYD